VTKRFIPITIIAMLLLFLPGVVADSFTVSISAIENTIYPNETANYRVTINNLLDLQDRFTVYTQDVNWLVSPASITVNESTSNVETLTLRPRVGTRFSNYLVPITFSSVANEGDFVTIPIGVSLRDPDEEPGMYVPNVALSVSPLTQVDPREKLPIEIKLRNRNGRVMDEVKVTVQSSIFFKEYLTNLEGWEEKTNTINIDLERLQEPDDYRVDVFVTFDNDTIATSSSTFTVIGYSSVPVVREDVKELFRQTSFLTVKNLGNYQKRETIRFESNWFSDLFSKSTPPHEVLKEDGTYYLAWDVSINPDETFQIIVVQNYRVLAIIVLALVLILIGYFVFRSPLVVYKQAKVIGSALEGISTVKVKLYVRNRTSRTLYNIKVLDILPHIAELIDDSSLGTLKPSKLFKHKKSGTVARWNLAQIDPFEERIISYKMRSKLKIVGTMTLPAMKAKFEDKSGKQRSTISRTAVIEHKVPVEK